MHSKVQLPREVSRRRFLESLALTGGGAFLAACSPAAGTETVTGEGTPEKVGGQPVTILFTHERPAEVFDPLAIDLIKERYPNINLVIDKTPFGRGWEDYINNVLTRIAGGEKLDVLWVATEGLALMSTKGILIPLDPFIEADEEARVDLESDMHPTLMRILKWQDKQMLIPFQWNSMVMHYNYVLFSEKGVEEPSRDWTWDDFLETCLKLADVTGSEDDLYAVSFSDQGFHIAPWYFNNDTSILKNDWADSNMDDPKAAETLQFLADLILKHKVAPNPAGWDESGQFHARHLAMHGCGGWCVGGAKNAGFSDYKFQYYPHKAGPLKTDVGVAGMGILATCEHPQEAWNVIKVLTSFEVQQNSMRIDGSPVSRRSVVETEEWMQLAEPAPADMSIFWESLDYAELVPSPPNFNVVMDVLRRWYAKIWNGELAVAEAVMGAHEELQAEMDLLNA